ncbi:rhodanese-like domain-containing protein [Thermoproteota archaeon]
MSKRNAIILLVVVAVLAVAAAVYTTDLMSGGVDPGDVSIQIAQELIEKKGDLVILDVRTVSEFDDGHIKEAINIPVQELPDRLDELDKNDELLVYCKTGRRSSTAVKILEEAGFTKIYNMHEGISAWIEQGFSIVQ